MGNLIGAAAPAPDPENTFNLDEFKRISPQTVLERKVITNIQVRNPKKNEFIRTNPDHNLRFEAMLAEDRGTGGGKVYMVKHDLQAMLYRYLTAKILVPTISSTGVEFLWAVNDTRDHRGDLSDWAITAQNAVNLAEKMWIKVLPNMLHGQYDVIEPVDAEYFNEPVFSLTDRKVIVGLAFKNHTITSVDHPWVKETLAKKG